MLNEHAVDQVFRALADSTRRALLEQLSDGPATVSELAEPFDVTLAAIVQHLNVLEESGLIHTEKVGRVRSCRIDPHALASAQQWIEARRSTRHVGSRRGVKLPSAVRKTKKGVKRKARARV